MATNNNLTININSFVQANNVLGALSSSFQNLTSNVEALWSGMERLSRDVNAFTRLKKDIESLNHGLSTLNTPAANLQKEMVNLARNSGKSVKELGQLEKYALRTALTFGGTAADSVKLYNTLITNLGDNLSDYPDALNQMGKQTMLFSKAMGVDQVEAVIMLKQKMEELGVSMNDPNEAARIMTSMVEGSTSVMELASEALDTYAEKQARTKAWADVTQIALSDMTLGFSQWIGRVTEGVSPALNFINVLQNLRKAYTDGLEILDNLRNAMGTVMNIDFAAFFTQVCDAIRATWRHVIALTNSLPQLTTQLLLLAKNGLIYLRGEFLLTGRGILILIGRFSQLAYFVSTELVKSLYYYMASLVTSGTTSQVFAGLASTSFMMVKISAVTCCRAIGVAVKSIPLFGWIIAIIGALGTLFVIAYNFSDKFRAWADNLWVKMKEGFVKFKNWAIQIFEGLWDMIKGLFTFDWKTFQQGLDKLTFKGKAEIDVEYVDAFDGQTKRKSQKPEKQTSSFVFYDSATYTPNVDYTNMGKMVDFSSPSPLVLSGQEKEDSFTLQSSTPDPIAGQLEGIGGSADKADKIKNIVVTIDKLVDKFEIHTTNIKEDVSQVKDMVAEVLLDAVNDLNYAM